MARKKRKPVLELYRVGRKGPVRKRKWQWRLIATNGEKICRGSQARGFATKRGCWSNAMLSCDLLHGIAGLRGWKVEAADVLHWPVKIKVAA